MPEKVVIKKLVLDVMKPHKPGNVEVGEEIAAVKGVDGCNITVVEIDKSVENVKITIEGSDITYGRIEALLEDSGATIHSIDKLSVSKKGRKIVEEAEYRH